MVYPEETELRSRLKRVGLTLKVAAQRLGMRPGTLGAKLTGWSYLLPEEREALTSVIMGAEKMVGRASHLRDEVRTSGGEL